MASLLFIIKHFNFYNTTDKYILKFRLYFFEALHINYSTILSAIVAGFSSAACFS